MKKQYFKDYDIIFLKFYFVNQSHFLVWNKEGSMESGVTLDAKVINPSICIFVTETKTAHDSFNTRGIVRLPRY